MKKGVCLIVLCILLALGAAFAKSGPKISLDLEFWDFGKVREGVIKEKIFIVENVGDEDLIIDAVFTDCGCTEANISQERIAFKEKAKLRVTYNTKGKSLGRDRKDIYIVSNDSVKLQTKITVTAEVIPSK